MNVGIFLTTFTGKGGMERIMLEIASGMVKRGHRCSFFHATHDTSKQDSYDIPLGVVRIAYPQISETREWLKGVSTLLRAASLDVCVLCNGCAEGRIYPVLFRNMHVPLVWTEHAAPQTIEQIFWNRPERLACMAAVDAIHVLCPGYRDSLPPFLQCRCEAIPNFPSLPSVAPSTGEAQRPVVLTVGKLVEATKQTSMLLRAFALLKDEFPDWTCRICGKGDDMEFYKQLINTLGMNERVILAGEVEDVASEYAAASLFAFPSRLEGFPLALAEAQASGLAAVGFADCPGVNEIIVHGENGRLAHPMTAEAFAGELRPLMADAALRNRMGECARELSNRFSRDHVLNLWEDLLVRAANTARPVALEQTHNIPDADIAETLRTLLERPFNIAPTMKDNIFGQLRMKVAMRDSLRKR